MSGVRVGSRLEQLETLQRRLAHEIDIERRHHALAVTSPAPEAVSHEIPAPRLTTIGPLPPAAVIRRWAIDNGYLMEHQRHGRISRQIADLYRDAVLS